MIYVNIRNHLTFLMTYLAALPGNDYLFLSIYWDKFSTFLSKKESTNSYKTALLSPHETNVTYFIVNINNTGTGMVI